MTGVQTCALPIYEDRKKSLAEHLEKLKTVVFQEGLGTVYDKSLRLEKLAGKIADAIGANDAEKKAAMRAALLSKADLVTGMVTEFSFRFLQPSAFPSRSHGPFQGARRRPPTRQR